MGSRRIVVATQDALTERMAGPAIRAWRIAEALSAEHDVQLVTTSKATVSHPNFPVRTVWRRELRELEAWCDVFLFQGFLLDGHPYLARSSKVMIVDVYDPFHLEQLEQSRDAQPDVRLEVVHGTVSVLNDQLLRGDFFSCASEKQRDFWLGQLAALGRVNPLTYDADETLRRLIDVVPFGVDDRAPVAAGHGIRGQIPGVGVDDKVILWGGGIYNWFDPLTPIRAVDRLRRTRGDVRLVFMGLKHPNPAVPEMRMAVAARRLSDDLGLTGKHVFFNEGWVPYDVRQNFLLDADIGVSNHLDHVETAFSFRTRILDYIWAAVPIVATGGDALAELIENRGLGLTVPAQDVEALEQALHRLLEDDELRESCRKRIREVAPDLTWSNALRPLLEFCRDPVRAPDLVEPQMKAKFQRAARWVHGERRGLRKHAETLFRGLRHGRVRELAGAVKARLVHRLGHR